MTREEILMAALERIRDWHVDRVVSGFASQEVVPVIVLLAMKQCAADALAGTDPLLVAFRESVHALGDEQA